MDGRTDAGNDNTRWPYWPRVKNTTNNEIKQAKTKKNQEGKFQQARKNGTSEEKQKLNTRKAQNYGSTEGQREVFKNSLRIA